MITNLYNVSKLFTLNLKNYITLYKKKLKADKQTTAYFALKKNVSSVLQFLAQDENTITKLFSYVYVASFFHVNKLHLRLLQTIAKADNVEFFFTKPDTSFIQQPTKPLSAKLSAKITTLSATCSTNTEIIALPSSSAEVLYAFKKTQELLNNKRCQPAEIAIAVSSNKHYLPYLLSYADNFSFSKKISLPIPLRMTSIGIFLHALSNYQLQEYQVHAVLDILANHNCEKFIPKAFEKFSAEELSLEISEMHVSGKNSLLSYANKTNKKSKEFFLLLDRQLQKYKAISCKEQLVLIEELLTRLEFLSTETYEDYSISRLLQFSKNIRDSHLGKEKIAVSVFWNFIANKFLQLPLNQTSKQAAEKQSVQIVSLAEMRAVSFKYVLVLGCVEGKFPKSLPNDIVLANSLKKCINLTSYQDLEARENEMFASLCHEATNLLMCYSEEEMCSHFVESMLRAGATLTKYNIADTLKMFHTPSFIHHQQQKKTFSDSTNWLKYNERLSASNLENFVRCPLRYLLQKLKIKPLQISSQGSAIEEGNKLHDIISKTINTSLCKNKSNTKASEISKRLSSLSDVSFCNEQEIAINQKMYAWHRLSEFLTADFFATNAKHSTEHTIALQTNDDFMQNTTCLLGRVDHLIQSGNYFWIIDYKRKSIPDKKEIKMQVALQLTFYAYLLDKYQRETTHTPTLARTIVSYFSILEGKLHVVAVGKSVSDTYIKQITKTPRAKPLLLEELLYKMSSLAEFRSKSVQEHGIYADASSCGKCQYDGICRKNDYYKQHRVNKFLSEYFEQNSE